ncbi:MAG: class I SAM-dependent methyltransferase [Caldilineae bacterium]|nr:MAG: class I SAM-dependent methyltransferase [Caldilineae bacterium]
MPLSFAHRDRLKQKWYPDVDERIFGVMHRALRENLHPGATVLDAGSGVGTWILKQYVDRIGFLIGIDIDLPDQLAKHAASANPIIHPVVADLAHIPLPSASVDLILCYNVVEHLPAPQTTFHEFSRLLKPGGTLLVKTPDLLSPTILASRLLPHAVHRAFKSPLGVEGDDVFPTYYRCNTPRRLDDMLVRAGLQRELLATVDQTFDYLYFTSFTYALGLLYSRATTLPGLRWLHNAIIALYRRPSLREDPPQLQGGNARSIP